LRDKIADEIYSSTGLEAAGREYYGWLGVKCNDIRSAVRMMRAMVVSNVLCRREGDFIYIPVNPSADPLGSRIVGLLTRAWEVNGWARLFRLIIQIRYEGIAAKHRD